MKPDELAEAIEAKLRGLRSCDTQATAVAWMTGAYKLMEQCLEHLKHPPALPPAVIVRERLVLVPERPALHVVQSIPREVAVTVPRHPAKWPGLTPTVVYQSPYLHPGLKPAPKAWTHADTVRLEKAVKAKAPPIQRRGQ